MSANPPETLVIPPEFMTVCYNSGRYPGRGNLDLSQGANCQLFAYALLRQKGIPVPPFRSSELWEDSVFSEKVTDLRPLDLLLFNHSPDAFGAHVAVYIGAEKAIHLSKEEGKPRIWSLVTFREKPAYRNFIGAKRIHILRSAN